MLKLPNWGALAEAAGAGLDPPLPPSVVPSVLRPQVKLLHATPSAYGPRVKLRGKGPVSEGERTLAETERVRPAWPAERKL